MLMGLLEFVLFAEEAELFVSFFELRVFATTVLFFFEVAVAGAGPGMVYGAPPVAFLSERFVVTLPLNLGNSCSLSVKC